MKRIFAVVLALMMALSLSVAGMGCKKEEVKPPQKKQQKVAPTKKKSTSQQTAPKKSTKPRRVIGC